MLMAFLILSGMGLVLFWLARRRGDGSHWRGLGKGWSMGLHLLPLLACAFVLAGLIQVALPPAMIQSWLGEGSGLRGIVIGTIAGALIAGGPYVSFPVIASIYQAGAGLGTTVAMISGWALLGLGQLPFELSIIGPRFTLVRLSVASITPICAGIMAELIFGTGLPWF